MTVEETHTGFMRQIIGKPVRRKADGTWVTPKAEVDQEKVGTQLEITYIRRKQGTVLQWVALRMIFDV